MNWEVWSTLAAFAIVGAAYGLERLGDWITGRHPRPVRQEGER